RMSSKGPGRRQSEACLVKHVAAFLRHGGYEVCLEIPNMGQSVDIVAAKGRFVTCIEAKISNWRRALRQCLAHELVADYICIAFEGTIVSAKLKRDTAALGYGLIWRFPGTSRCEWAVTPSRNRNVWGPQRTKLVADLRSVKN